MLIRYTSGKVRLRGRGTLALDWSS